MLSAWKITLATLLITGLSGTVSATGDPPSVAEQRELFLQAEEAFRLNDDLRYEQLKQQLRDYPLYPYLSHQEMRSRLGTARPAEVELLLAEYPEIPAVRLLRGQYLRQLGKTGRWSEFLDFYTGSDQARLRCHHLEALYRSGQQHQALEQVRDLWLVGRSQPKSCDRIFKLWQDSGRLTPELAWQRTELAMRNRKPGLARYLRRFLTADGKRRSDLWRRIHRQPALALKPQLFKSADKELRAIRLHGLQRLAWREPQRLLEHWQALNGQLALDDSEQTRLKRAAGLTLARSSPADALRELDLLPTGLADGRVVEARLWAALRMGRWEQARLELDGLVREQNQERWQYWRARVLEALGEVGRAWELYGDLARERSYYGFLAADRLELPYDFNHRVLAVDDDEIVELSRRPGAQRARELFLLKRRTDFRREWYQLVRGMGPGDLAVAARMAQQWAWHPQTIMALGRASCLDDLDLRFPLPHRPLVIKHADAKALEPAWLFAMMRQESAFADDARSPAGARGIMQLMPRTALQVARRENLRLSGNQDLYQADLNIQLGSSYLATLLEKLEAHPALAIAAYNAGPHRVRQWLPEDAEMPAELWIELVPFKETRNYLKRVLTYTAIYQHRLGQQPVRLSQRLSPIPTRTRLSRKQDANTSG